MSEESRGAPPAPVLRGRSASPRPRFEVDFVFGAYLEVRQDPARARSYRVEFIDQDAHQEVYSVLLPPVDSHARTHRRWFSNYLLRVSDGETNEIVFEHRYDAEGEKVLIVIDSTALGDCLAWVPYVEEFRKKHRCHAICATLHHDLFREVYPEIEFIGPEDSVEGLYAAYQIEEDFDDVGIWHKCPRDSRLMGMQEHICSILGLEYQEQRPRVRIQDRSRKIEGKYVCISVQSTAQCKYWNNPTGWQETVRYLKGRGYEVVCIDKYDQFGIEGGYNWIPAGVMDKTGDIDLQDRITDLLHCEFFIGLSSGLAWLAWAVEKPVVLISGVTAPSNEFHTPYRVFNPEVCNSCWHDPEYAFDRTDWLWCPRHQGTERMFECSRQISFERVKEQIDRLIEEDLGGPR